jgi:hypothetical protein
LNLNAGYWDIFWPQFIQGACLALLFVRRELMAKFGAMRIIYTSSERFR